LACFNLDRINLTVRRRGNEIRAAAPSARVLAFTVRFNISGFEIALHQTPRCADSLRTNRLMQCGLRPRITPEETSAISRHQLLAQPSFLWRIRSNNGALWHHVPSSCVHLHQVSARSACYRVGASKELESSFRPQGHEPASTDDFDSADAIFASGMYLRRRQMEAASLANRHRPTNPVKRSSAGGS
jgi:hypothetical protein